jgi:hypothetical protein
MKQMVSARAGPELVQRWRQQIACQRRRREARGPRHMTAVGHLARGPIDDGMIDVRRLMFVVVHDQLRANETTAIRVAGYSSTPISWGVQIGGAKQTRFEKDLARAPGVEVCGRRFNLQQGDVLSLALELDCYLERHSRYPGLPRLRQPRWPQLWAAFDPNTAGRIQPDGPEWQDKRQDGAQLGTEAPPRRAIFGLVAFPLEFVSHAWRQFAAVFADLKSMPKRQVIALDHPERSLQGFCGAIEYDLLSSRFSRPALRPR